VAKETISLEAKPEMTSEQVRSQFRLSKELHQQLKAAALESGRSLNSELVQRLADSFLERPDSSTNVQNDASERLKVELVLEFEEWYRQLPKSKQTKGALIEFCRLYNGGDPEWDELEPIPGIEVVNPKLLRELAVAYRWYSTQSPHVAQTLAGLSPPSDSSKCDLLISYLEWCCNEQIMPMSDRALYLYCNEDRVTKKGTKYNQFEVSPPYLKSLATNWYCNFMAEIKHLEKKASSN
jgi:hypothetical protein